MTINEKQYEREKREDSERWGRYQLTGRYVSHEFVSARLVELATAGKITNASKAKT